MANKKTKIGTIAWHEDQIKQIRATHSKKAKAQHAKKRAEKKYKYQDHTPTTLKKPLPRYRSRIEYDFLKYVRIVFKWALENNKDLNRPNLELLLYLYGVGAFSKKQFNDYHKLLGLYAIKTLTEFEENGWIKLWRAQKGRQHALYTLTQKGKILCNKMHRYSCGVEEIPENPVSNDMMKKGSPRINGYYMDMIKRMNKDKAPTEE